MIIKRTHKSTGQSMVEFALILPLLVLFIVMIIDIGRVAFYYSSIYNASKEGARYGIVTPNIAGMISAAEGLLVGLDIDDVLITPTIIKSEGPDNKDIQVRVAVTYDFVPVTPLAAQLLGSDKITLKSVSTMYIEK